MEVTEETLEEVKRSSTDVPATMDALQEFGDVISRTRDPEMEARFREKLERYLAENERQRPALLSVMEWADAGIRTAGDFASFILKGFRFPRLPTDQELVALARHYYPPRMELKVHVSDFGDDRSSHFETTLGEIERCWEDKPDWAISVEDLFLHGGDRGRPFLYGGSAGFPYIETEALNFRSRQNVQEMRNVYMILSKLEELHPQLDQISLNGDNNKNLTSDIEWRAGHLESPMGYWSLVESDMPWQLSEGIDQGQGGVWGGLTPIGRVIDGQELSTHPFFRDSQLKGFLLTLAPPTGVDYLDKYFRKYLREPIECMPDNDDASVLGHMLQLFAKSGTSSWHRKTVEWLAVYMITEFGATPHTIRQGHNAVSVVAAYRTVVQDLKRRRYDPWKRNESVKLVREYLTCIDELTSICLILSKKVQMFEGLLQDCKAMEAEDSARAEPGNPSGKSMIDRVEWAATAVKDQHDSLKRFSVDLELAMNALFQLRSIEQNELAIVADSQNKAILVFTGVTIIFLPLSFFTSYYGMNLQGIANTHKDEAFFWKVCGTVAFMVILFVVVYAFRNKLRGRLLNPTPHNRIV
ncbi:hypothetical protein FGG08_005216 [Glutinoglossum americanum]|uniref:Uncharacterized protein n=1 Tax=Glutinoglossum americanum TaxID=1670608 RepID=A0A9P8HUW9_9PEZI|nr:hypothetical protein FGG08_005216 [Glutinoglossum americanum]